MLIPNHPDDERLSALASGDPDALADSALSEHVASCVRCTDAVAELGALRASLAELPDLTPHRPLRLLPPVDEPAPSRVDALGGWARRFFAPVLTAGAALALVGLVGTTAPLLGGLSGSQTAAPADLEQEVGTEIGRYGIGTDDAAATEEPAVMGAEGAADATVEPAAGNELGGAQPLESEGDGNATADSSGADSEQVAITEDRPIFPMLLFAGVAIMIAAALLRWILAPRAG